jgi:hypothetical protein
MKNSGYLLEKRAYLVGKMIDGAGAIDEFFTTLINNKDYSPEKLTEELCDKYDLTDSQRSYLNWVSARAKRVKAVVNYLENRFGADESGTFKGPEALHRLLYDDKRIQRGIKAKSHNITIEIEKPKWYHKSHVGVVRRGEYDGWDAPADEIIEGLGDAEKYDNCKSIATIEPSVEAFLKDARKERSPETKLFLTIFGKKFSDEENFVAEKCKEHIHNHELRHVFDNILNPRRANRYNYTPYSETQSYIYSGSLLKDGIFSDMMSVVRLRKKYRNDLKELEMLVDSDAVEPVKMPDKLLNHLNKRVKQLKGAISKMDRTADDFAHVLDSGFGELPSEDLKSLSYLFSTIDSSKIPHRIDMVTEALRNG